MHPTLEREILKFARQRYAKNLIVPSIRDIQTYFEKKEKKKISRFEIQRIRNKLEIITRFHPVGDDGKDRNRRFRGLVTAMNGWIEIDMFFMGQHKTKYGQGIIAVDILTKRVYAQSVPNKKTSSFEDFIKDLIQTPGFTSTRRILSDKEAAVQSLEKQKKFKNIKFITTQGKAKMAERYIRTLKLYLSKLALSRGISLMKWRELLPEVLEKMNTKKLPGKIPGILEQVRPIDLNKKMTAKYIDYMLFNSKRFFFNFHPVLTPQNPDIAKKIFKFSIGDKVYLAKKKHINSKVQKQYWGETRSISGHFSKFQYDSSEPDVYTVHQRKLENTSMGYIVPVYKLKDEDGDVTNFFYEQFIRPYPNKV